MCKPQKTLQDNCFQDYNFGYYGKWNNPVPIETLTRGLKLSSFAVNPMFPSDKKGQLICSANQTTATT